MLFSVNRLNAADKSILFLERNLLTNISFKTVVCLCFALFFKFWFTCDRLKFWRNYKAWRDIDIFEFKIINNK